MMEEKYEIYFDESQKIDKRESIYSFYGIIGIREEDSRKLGHYKIEELKFDNELHFSEFKLAQVDNYINILEKAMELVDSKIYVIDIEKAYEYATKLNISIEVLRKLFYVKIPERLIYGMTRLFKEFTSVNIYIDKSEEYGSDNMELFNLKEQEKISDIINDANISFDKKATEITNLVNEIHKHIHLTKSLKEQLNAQSLYRDLNFKIDHVYQKDSKQQICLQISDIVIGIFGFLFEKKYLDLPKQIGKELMKEILNNERLTREEKNILKECYLEKKNDYILRSDLENLNVLNDLKEINKKIKVYSGKNISKCELIYRCICNKSICDKLNQINIFIWASNTNVVKSDNLGKVLFSHYISSFLQFKTEFDNKNKNIILEFHNDSIKQKKYKFKEYRNALNLKSENNLVLDRYLKELNIECLD